VTVMSISLRQWRRGRLGNPLVRVLPGLPTGWFAEIVSEILTGAAAAPSPGGFRPKRRRVLTRAGQLAVSVAVTWPA
jgi:hypothetical protein